MAEVSTMQINPNGTYKIKFTYPEQTVQCPSINFSKEEYELLKTNRSSKVHIVRTRRGMIWRRYNRLKYEQLHKDRYEKAVAS